MDVLSASYYDAKIAWYENDGNANFTSHTITTNAGGAISVYAADLDGDEDIDVLSASFGGNKIAWYENSTITGITNNHPDVVPEKPILYDNYPNPFNPETTIEFDVAKNLPVTLKVYDLQGREVTTLINKQLPPGHYKVTFHAGDLASGLYFYQIRMGGFQTTKRMILIR
jgi:hypothetical protein